MFCAYTRPRYQVSIFRTICPLILILVAEWPPFGKELLTELFICSLCILSICNLSYFPFGFEGGIGVLITLVPGHCILVACFIASTVLRQYDDKPVVS